MVLIEESVLAVVINHVVLLFADNFSRILEVPFARTELPEVAVIDTDAMDTGINGRSPPDLRLRSVDVGPYISNWKIVSNSLHRLQHLARILDPWHFSHCERIILVQNLGSHLVQELVSFPTDIFL